MLSIDHYNVATRPSASMAFVTINSTGWTQIWGADANRSFAAVLGGTGVTGDNIYVTANPLAAPGDADVAVYYGVRGAFYLETRGTNALYALRSSGSPLVVRTTATVQIPKVPAPTGLIGTKDYGIATSCGHKLTDYISDLYAPVLPRENDRLRTTILGSEDLIMIAGNLVDPSFLGLIVISAFLSSGPAFPGPLSVEGASEVVLLNLSNVGKQITVSWVSDKTVGL